MASLEHADLEPATHGKIIQRQRRLRNGLLGPSPLQVDLDASQNGLEDW